MTNRNKSFIDKDLLFMTKGKEAEMRLQGLKSLGQRKRKWEGNTSLKKVLSSKERIPQILSGLIALLNLKYKMSSNKYSVLTLHIVFCIYMEK